MLRFADLSLDPGTRDVRRGNRLIELTRTEFLLLELFLRNPKQVLPREVIFDRVWGYDFGLNSNSLEVYIGYLRRKTESEGEAQAHPHRPGRRLRDAPPGGDEGVKGAARSAHGAELELPLPPGRRTT